jgi:uncharacterized protein YjiK
VVIAFASCNRSVKTDESRVIYKETKDYEVFEMPNELKEISGINFINDSTIAAIEDETGTLYFYNIIEKKIIRKETFAKDSDYEDITRNGNTLYIVESNGNIYEIADFNAPKLLVNMYETKLKGKNDIEGICYDASSQSLLLSVKEINLGKDKDDMENKNIYKFDLKTKLLDPKPVYKINLQAIEDFFAGNKVEEASKKFLKAIGNKNLNEVFKTSSIAFHPITKELYVLSSINKIILVIDGAGGIKKIIPLNGSFFSQPEGIAFDSKGMLYISNEGKKNPGNIIKVTEK